MGKIALATAQVKVPTPGTPVPLSSTSLWVNGLVIQALSSNTHSVFVAPVGSAPATHGHELIASDYHEIPAGDLIDLSTIQLDAVTATEGVTLTWNVPLS